MTIMDEDPLEKTPFVKEIPPKAADLSAWYQAVCYKAELVSLSPVRGCVVLRPYGFGLWERLQAELDGRFKATGHETRISRCSSPNRCSRAKPTMSKVLRPK